jgi:DNA modification methylase/ParB-like chromosome segregation protein Spo0J
VRNRDIQIEHWRVDRLIPNDANPRTHTPEQVAQIAASILEFGFVNPILTGSDGRIIAGEGRHRAALKLGLRKVPVIVLEHLSEIQRRALAIADNQLALNAGWNDERLREQLAALHEQDFNLDLLGFDDEELARRLEHEAAAGLIDEDEVPDVPTIPVTRPGDLWLLGPHKGQAQHRVLCADATSSKDTARLLSGHQPPFLMVIDPPYGVDLEPEWREQAGLNPRTRQSGKVINDDRVDWSEAWALFPGNVVYVWHAGIHAAEVARGLEVCGFQIRSQIIWVKQHFAISRGAYHWRHEPCWYAVRQGQTAHWRGGRTQSTVWEVANLNPFGGEGSAENEPTGHGTQKPVELMRRPILNHTRRGEVCYDPFLGSGSTLIAAESSGRICYGIDINPSYVDVAVLRWQRYTGKSAVLDGDGRTFDEIARSRQRNTGRGEFGLHRGAGGGRC